MYNRPPSSSSADGNIVAHSSIAEEVEASKPGLEPQAEWHELKNARKKVALHRDELFRRRLWLKEKRNALQEERTNIAKMEAEFMTFIRQYFNESVLFEPSSMRTLYAELKPKRAALETKRDELGALQYDYDQVEIDHNLKEIDLDEEEQHFESLVFEVLGLSDSSQGEFSDKFSSNSKRYMKNQTPHSPAFESDHAESLVSNLRTNNESVLATIRQSVPKAGPGINWWILHTFGCTPIDYVQRAQALQGPNDKTLDEEIWARLVSNFWRLEKEQAEAGESSEDFRFEMSTEELPEPNYIFTIDGSYLVLSSQLMKARYTVKNYDLLFPSDQPTVIFQDDSVSQDLDSLPNQHGQNDSPVSDPAAAIVRRCLRDRAS